MHQDNSHDASAGRLEPECWEEDTLPGVTLQRGAYLMLEERCLGRIDPANDEPIDFVPVEARCAEVRAEEQVP